MIYLCILQATAFVNLKKEFFQIWILKYISKFLKLLVTTNMYRI